MGTVPQSYYDFVTHYAPYYYVISTVLSSDAVAGQKVVVVSDGTKFQTGYPVQIKDASNSEWNIVSSVVGNNVTMQNNLQATYHVAASGAVEGPDPAYGKGAFPAAFAIDFLYQAYSSTQFQSNKTDILNKITVLADFILTQQCTNQAKKAYGGFASAEGGTQYWSIDAGRCIPALLEAYDLSSDSRYLNAAILAGSTFLQTMQNKQTYGGFARAVAIDDTWLLQLDVESLYCLIGLKLLANKYDTSNATVYQAIMSKAVGFFRYGLENLYLDFDPADGKWHRVGLGETDVYDDSIGFALLGLYTYEGWSSTCQQVYCFLQRIRASAQYSAYNPSICWPGYIDVVNKMADCAYYDDLTIGILGTIRAVHDKPSYALAMQVLSNHQSDFLFWGPLFTDYSPITSQKAMANVTWLARFFLGYQEPSTDFNNLVNLSGETLSLFPVLEAADSVTWGEALSFKAVVALGAVGEVVLEPGYITEDNITVYSLLPVRVHDKIRRNGVDYEVLTVQCFDLNGDPQYYKSACRKLIMQ
ncbi:MAG: hypothetical protein ABSB10_00555 [Candidatus Bathyarchaeia archaeon]|jgi:hypothetical protein